MVVPVAKIIRRPVKHILLIHGASIVRKHDIGIVSWCMGRVKRRIAYQKGRVLF
jgi:hypothetical protein